MKTSDRACFIAEAVSPCSERWHEMMTTDVAYLIPEVNHSDSCYEMITTDGACFILYGLNTMLCPLSWDDENDRTFFIPEEI